jgi:hypothetical protein
VALSKRPAAIGTFQKTIGGRATLKMLRHKSKTQFRAQYTERNCAFELFKAHCAKTINAKNASFPKKIFQRKECKRNFLK